MALNLHRISTDAKPNAMKACFQMAEARRRKTEGQLEATIAALLKRQFRTRVLANRQ